MHRRIRSNDRVVFVIAKYVKKGRNVDTIELLFYRFIHGPNAGESDFKNRVVMIL